jgi:metal-responsive CopG/Arc/MetJ family transcriptional regulator
MANQRVRQRITISLDKEALETLSSIASKNDVSIAKVIRYAVDNLLKEWKEGRQHQLQLILPIGGKKEVAVT